MPPHRRALLFVDNSGADIVLGMLPLARELLRRGTEFGSYTVTLFYHDENGRVLAGSSGCKLSSTFK
ncbi:hypothetical protein RIF29_21243 [Crotalaria pallida]|uniref:Uncharacterized protein n=1 Tax=Crotalaria pallida TaxID=3830 RepID=A0AAN9F2N9_CROPI